MADVVRVGVLVDGAAVDLVAGSLSVEGVVGVVVDGGVVVLGSLALEGVVVGAVVGEVGEVGLGHVSEAVGKWVVVNAWRQILHLACAYSVRRRCLLV